MDKGELKMKNIAITVIIPVYNVKKYLDKMLKSVYNQTFKNFEVIVVNDGSTDNSEEIILRYVEKYDNIQYIKQKNSGVSEARNKALCNIQGKYTLFLDSDDYIEKTMLEKLYKMAEKNSSDITICGYRIFFENRVHHDINHFYNIDENKVYNNTQVMEMVLNDEVMGFLWNKLFLTRNVNKFKMHFDKDRYSQDWMPVFKQISLSNKITFINEPLYNYRIRDNSNSHNKSFKIVEDHNFAIRSIVNYICENNIILNKNKFYTFIINNQANEILISGYDRCNINKNIYEICEIKSLRFSEVLIYTNISLKLKIKFILFKLKVLHKYFRLIRKY